MSLWTIRGASRFGRTERTSAGRSRPPGAQEVEIGIDINGVRFLIYAKRRGADFERTATIGRQELHTDEAGLHAALSTLGPPDGEILGNITTRYAEPLLNYLGARSVESFDYSDYESPSFVHDMNAPVPEAHQQAYTTVLDGGSLEHVFNFPVAIMNCMKMVKIGGRYLGITPANNFFGHGFYQFSPELYFSVLSPENGFQNTRVVVFEDVPDTLWYEAREPRKIGERVILENSRPVYLGVISEKVKHVGGFERWPQQSDYEAVWQGGDRAPPATPPRSLMRPLVRRLREAFRAPPSDEFRPQHFDPIDWSN